MVLKHDNIEDSAWAVRNILEKCPNLIKFIFFESNFFSKLVTSLSESHFKSSTPVSSFLSESYQETLIVLNCLIIQSE